MKIDRTSWSVGSLKDSEKEESEALSKMTYQGKSAIITFLRESYYGRQATTGRLQRIFEVSEHISKSDLMKNKAAAKRPKDLADLAELKRIK